MVGTEQLQKETYTVITDIWKQLKPRINVREDEQYWTDAIEAFAGIAEQYKGTPVDRIAHHMSVAAVNALEDIYRQQMEVRDGSD